MKLNGNLTFKVLGSELRNAIIERLASDPVSTEAGRIYYNTTDNEYRYYNNTSWQPFGEGVIASNIVTASGGIYQADGTYDATTVDAALGNSTGSTDLLDALSQLDQAISGAAESYRIKDADSDTIVRTASTGVADEDVVEILLGNKGDDWTAGTVATFGRASTDIGALNATSAATGGYVNITAGDGAGSSEWGGNVEITTGTGYYGGQLILKAADTGATDSLPGEIFITAGNATSPYGNFVHGGNVYMAGGNSNYRGGHVFIEGGQTSDAAGSDGNILIETGGSGSQSNRLHMFGSDNNADDANDIRLHGANGANSGTAATIEIFAGGSAGAIGGDVQLRAGSGATDGSIIINNIGSNPGALLFEDGDGSDTVGFKAPSAMSGTSITYTLPDDSTVAEGYVLKTTAAGVLTWVSGSAAGTIAINDLTDVIITSGTTNDLLQLNGSGDWVNVAIGATSGTQAYDAGLDSLAGLAASSGDVIYATATDTYAVAQPGATSGVQAYDAGLDSVAALTAVSGDLIYATAADTYAVAQPGVTTGVQPYDVQLAEIAALTPSTDNFIVGNGTNWTLEAPADARTSLGLVAGGTGDIWVEKAGDTMDSAANLVFTGGGEVTGLPATPSGATAATSKDYVDSIVAAGTVWEDPITDPDLVGIATVVPPTPDAATTYIAFGGSYPQTWGSVTDVASLNVLERNADDTDWVRLSAALSDGRFIITGDHGTFGITDDLYTTAELRSKDLVQWVVGSSDPSLAASWTRPHNGAYQVIDFSTIKTGASSTGFANDVTVYVIDVRVGATTYNVLVTGSTAQTIATLITEINTDLTGATASLDETGGHIHIEADDGTSEILITHTAVGGTDMTTVLTDFLEIRGGVTNGTTVLVNDPDSSHFGDQFHYAEQNNDWTLIGGPSSVQAGTGLSKSGTVLNVNMGAGIIELPSDQVGMDLRNSSSGALLLTTDGTTREGSNASSALWLRLAGDDAGSDTNGSALTQDTEGLRIALNALSGLEIDNAGVDTGTLKVNPKTATGIAINGGDGELELTAIPNSSLTNTEITFGDGTNTDAVALGETQVATGAIVGANTIKYRRIEDSDGDTYIQTSSAVAGDEDTVQIVLADSTAAGDDYGDGTAIVDFGRQTTTFTGAYAYNGANGGNFIIVGGESEDLHGGGIAITGGEGYENGGDITLEGGYSGNMNDEGRGGEITLQGGVGYTGGNVNILGGVGYGQYGGTINITAGSDATGDGGLVNITAGNGSGSTSGGDIAIVAGSGTGSNAGGDIVLETGSTGSGSISTVTVRNTDVAEPGILVIAEATGSDTIGFTTAASIASSITYTLPEAPAADGYLLSSTTGGVMSWVTTASVGATRLEDLDDVVASTTSSVDAIGNVLVSDGTDSYDTQTLQFNYDSSLNGGANTSHTVNHALGQRFVNVTVYDAAFNQVIPQTVVLTDTNNVTVTFNSSIQCYVVVMGVPGVALA